MNELSRLADWHSPPGQPEVYHIEATKSLVDRPLRTLKNDDLFGVFDRQGDCVGVQGAPDGLFFRDTRFLSLLELRLGGLAPMLLSSVLLDNNSALSVDMTNADLHDAEGKVWVQRDSLHVGRTKFLCGNSCHDRITIRRFDPLPGPVPVDLHIGADFADLFEVRGEVREQRGQMRAERVDGRSLRFVYRGLDGVERRTTLQFDPAPERLTVQSAHWQLDLAERDRASIYVRTTCDSDGRPSARPSGFARAYRTTRRASRARAARLHSVSSSNQLVNAVFNRAAADIDMLLTETEYGLYPYAGIPWYSTIFGRDGIITALQLLWAAPDIAKGVLRALALTQATDVDPAADAEPGKIIHEMRGGEMAALGEVPFRRYYGTVDATPLFVMLAGAYLQRTGDLDTIRAIWPNIEAALDWLDQHGDSDGDGFVEYHRLTERGLANQGWKDSHDSIFHADGSLAEGPIALCEVQAYAYAARLAAADIADALSDGERSLRLREQADRLRRQFEEQFWLEDLGCYALALDGRKQPCRILSSNAGHALFTGIASPERAERLAALFMDRPFFTGWGIRTIANREPRYNPMSYHNGSVWPHDNALIAMGLARYGYKAQAARIFQGLVEAATYDEFSRLPELFCGFSRRRGRGFTAYPVACAPQAWAAAAPFALAAAAAGLEIDQKEACLKLHYPVLPPIVDAITLRDIEVAGSRLDVNLRRSHDDVTVEVIRRQGDAGVMILK
ncbi:amylo-alpha-1,6-glucosidase [Sphingosinicella sp. YJ22]|uniref:amylo-alpha-1,6-glucosidase n=1 Tax=Sphingosinicella sp. YJ22 TaxID=1104780 RepID=UPI00140B0DDB|nr:amylo-alpha-1,6-glucosidase [Sphingosinicella sp. YJ22]